MFKKVIAGIASVALALGMVALTAAPASAHTPSASGTCTTVSVNLTQYDKNDTNHLEVWLDGTRVENIADFGQSFSQSYAFTQVLATHTWQVIVDVSPGTQYDWTKSDTETGCIDDSGVSKPLCHKGSNGYTSATETVGNLVNHTNNTHGDNSGGNNHSDDIIPPFTYSTPGHQNSTYAGQHWDAAGQEIYNNNCAPRAPAAPTWVPGVCTAAGQASAGVATLPAGPWPVGVTYRYSIYTGSGPGSFTTVGNAGGPAITVPAGSNIQIQARKANNTVNTWTFAAGPLGAKCITAVAPTFTPKVCTGPGQSSQAWYSVTATANVTYKNGTSTLTAGTQYPVNTFPTTITLTATAAPGFVLFGTGTWANVFSAPANDCYGTPQAPQASYTDGYCYAAGVPTGPTVTIFAATGIASFQLSINGGPFAPFAGSLGSAYTLPVGTTSVQVRPIAAANYLPAADLAVHNYVSPGDCIYQATPAASAIAPICTTGEGEKNPELGPSYVRLFWNTGVASYNVPGVGIVSRPADPAPAYSDVVAGSPLATLTITANPLYGYALSVLSVDVTFPAKIVNQCGDGLITDPKSTNEVCSDGEAAGGSIWVDRMEDVRYTITGGTLVNPIVIDGLAGPGDLYADGTVPLRAGTYTVTPSALNGAIFAPVPENLPAQFTISAPEESCVISFQIVCSVGEGGSMTLPDLDHVLWTVVVTSGPTTLFDSVEGPVSFPVTTAATAITAELDDPDLVFAPGQHAGWSVQLEQREVECGELLTFAPIPTNVTWTAEKCVDGKHVGATLTVGDVEGESFFAETNYYLDDSATPLTAATTAISAGHHKVTASVVDPDDTIEEGSLDLWEFDVPAAPVSCDLTTLALTGVGNNPIGWAGIGYYLLVTGLALIAVRTVRRRNEVKQK